MDLTRKVAARWLLAWQNHPLHEEFWQKAYDGGKRKVRNTNRDSMHEHTHVTAETLLKTDPKFRKLVRGQFQQWLKKREKEGPGGQEVTSLGDLQQGHRLQWQQGKQIHRGEVQQARGNRAILQMEDGSTKHLRKWDIDALKPRIV